MANKLNPELVQNIAELTNVKKISDLPIIDVIDKDNETAKIRTSQQFNNSYLLSSTLIEDNSQVGGRYFNYRVKLNEVTEYLSTLSDANLAVFKQTFDFFVDSLKNNTENSYVQFTPANDTIDTENTDNNYSYTFRYKLSEVLDEVNGFTYNITSDGIEEISTYSYTNVLTEGLVTNVTLEKYVRNSIANILGVPSTPAALTDAIDSVIEFVEWFKGYSKERDGLAELVRKFTEKDSEIISSYIEADSILSSRINATNSRIDSLDTTKNAEAGKYITGIQQKDGLITYITSKQIEINEVDGLQSAIDSIEIPVTGVADSGNTLTISGTEYTLSLNSDKKLLFNVYTKISYTACTGTQHFEYNSGAHSFTVSAKPTKKCTVTNRWEDSSAGTSYNANVAISANVSVSNNTSGLFNLIIKETDKTPPATKEAIVNYAFDYYDSWQYVTDELITSSNIGTKFTSFTKKNTANANGYVSQYNFTVSGEKYVYILIRKSSATFIIGSGTIPGQNPGGVEKICEYKPYGNASGAPTYYLYRSSRVQTANCNITVS